MGAAATQHPRGVAGDRIHTELRARDLLRVRGSMNATFREALALCRADGRTVITERDIRKAADAVEYQVLATGGV